MGRKSIAQEYFRLVTNEKGMLPAMRRDESNAPGLWQLLSWICCSMSLSILKMQRLFSSCTK